MQFDYIQDKEFTAKKALLPFIKRIFKYALVYKKWFWTFVCFMGVVAIIDALFPYVWMYFIDNAITPSIEGLNLANEQGTAYEPNFLRMAMYASIYFIMGIVQITGIYFFVKFAGFIQEHVLFDLRKALFAKLQKMQFSYFDKNSSGWLLSRITSDTDRVTELISWGFIEFIWGVTMIVFCTAFMFTMSVKLTLVVLISIPVLIVISFKIRMLILKYSRLSRKVNSELIGNYTENINGVAVNKSTAQEFAALGRFKRFSGDMNKASFRAQLYTAMYGPLVIFVGTIVAAIMILWGGQLSLSSIGLTIGEFQAFLAYATLIFMPIWDIARFYSMAQGSLSAGERIFSLLDEEVLIKDKDGATDYGNIKGDISFKNLNFEYVKGKPVLNNLNLKIKAGQSVALVGATGEGKTTIASLISRFYEPTSGVVKIDNENYLDKTLKSLRSQMGVVLQQPYLFSGTIKENILFTKQNATDAEVENALKLVGASEFIERLNEEVGEGGEHLSEGERQLISFARAVIVEPAIFVMDEATSSIDTLTEAKIQNSIQNILEGRTSIVIAHRLSTIKTCDRILVIQKGQIIEDGNHEALLQLKGKYYHLYTKQLRLENATNIS